MKLVINIAYVLVILACNNINNVINVDYYNVTKIVYYVDRKLANKNKRKKQYKVKTCLFSYMFLKKIEKELLKYISYIFVRCKNQMVRLE